MSDKQRARELVLQISQLTVELAKVLGEEPARCDCASKNITCIHEAMRLRRPRYPCSATCTHDDASNPGHPERVRALGEAIGPLPKLGLYGPAEVAAWEAGVEAMRAACLEVVQAVIEREGLSDPGFKAAIEAVEP